MTMPACAEFAAISVDTRLPGSHRCRWCRDGRTSRKPCCRHCDPRSHAAGEDGLSLARKLRAQGNLPIIMLSARGEDVDRIVGLEVGADDYLPSLQSPRIAGTHPGIIAPQQDSHPAAGAARHETHRFGPFMLNLDTHDLHKNGKIC